MKLEFGIRTPPTKGRRFTRGRLFSVILPPFEKSVSTPNIESRKQLFDLGRLGPKEARRRFTMDLLSILRGHELFKALSIGELEQLAAIATVRSLEKDAVVFQHDSRGEHVFLLLEGRVRLWLPALSNDFSLVVGQIDSGSFFGLAPLLGAERHTTTARCASPCEVLALEATPLRALLFQNTRVGVRFLEVANKTYFTRYIETLKRFQNILSHISIPT